MLRARLLQQPGWAQLMDDCCAPASSTKAADHHDPGQWWQDSAILIPAASGLALLIGLSLEGLTPVSGPLVTAVFWASLLLGASQFVPSSLRGLVPSGRLSIGLLMTISAIGAVLLGFIEEAAALAFLYSIAEALEHRAMTKAQSGLRALLALIPSTATLITAGGVTRSVPVEDLLPGDVLRLVAGERLATDGTVRTGRSSLDVSAITGESIPVEVGPGDQVRAGSINISGSLEVEATAAGTDNSLTTVVALVEQAQHDKGERARIADRLARPLVPGVLILAVLVAVIGSVLGDPGVWIERALVVLVAASPCALGISVPVTVVSAIGAASKFGVVIKSGAAFERLGGIRHLALDKTGTLTRNHPTVTSVLVDDQIAVGSPRWLPPGPLASQVETLERRGETVVIVHRGGQPVGAIGVRDELRPEAFAVIESLTAKGLGVTMLTGDNARTAKALAEEAGITDVRAQLRPADKATAVIALRDRGPVAMIGDGINDAPALASADIGIAMGATGSDAAVESADIAFTGDDLSLIPRALHHARRGRAIITQNIVLSLAIIIILLPLAITGVLGLAAVVLVHEVAEVIVIANGLRAARTGVAASRTPAGTLSTSMPSTTAVHT